MATTLKFSWIQVLYDMEKFYDRVGWHGVVETAYVTNYPLVVLALGLQIHMAPRRVATDEAISGLIWPTRGLIAGCGQSIDLARLALWQVSEYAHEQSRPRDLSTWEGDLAHQEQGREQEVVRSERHWRTCWRPEALSSAPSLWSSPTRLSWRSRWSTT